MTARPEQPPADVVCLMGQTAAGKTDIAVELCRRFPVAIVSVDSAMVYRGMDIGTAKPGPDVLREAPHRLIDIREPDASYSAGEFCADAAAAIRDILAENRIPLLVGGTMLYFRALTEGLSHLPTAEPAVRAQIDREAAERGWPVLHEELARVDPVAAARIEPTDAQRIQRALEVYRASGRALSEWHRLDEQTPPSWRFVKLALVAGDRSRLRDRIRRRLDTMIEAGFPGEVAGLLSRPGVDEDRPSMRAVGYRQLARYVRGQCGLDQAVQEARVATGRLAKRQHTWLRRERGVVSLDALDPACADRIFGFVEEVVRCRMG